MNESAFKICISTIALLFTALFCVLVIPPLMEKPDIIAAFAAGFVNPFASGYSADVICCWLILAAWVWHEASQKGVRYGWICLLLGIIPGVAAGFALYLLIRHTQLGKVTSSDKSR